MSYYNHNNKIGEDFRFECNETGEYTDSLKTALAWHMQGMCVEFYTNDNLIGIITYAGHFRDEACLPDDGDYGVVYSAGEENSLYISYPDEADFAGNKYRPCCGFSFVN